VIHDEFSVVLVGPAREPGSDEVNGRSLLGEGGGGEDGEGTLKFNLGGTAGGSEVGGYVLPEMGPFGTLAFSSGIGETAAVAFCAGGVLGTVGVPAEPGDVPRVLDSAWPCAFNGSSGVALLSPGAKLMSEEDIGIDSGSSTNGAFSTGFSAGTGSLLESALSTTLPMEVTELRRLEIRLLPAKGLRRILEGNPVPTPGAACGGGEEVGEGAEFAEVAPREDAGGEDILDGATKSLGRFSLTMSSSIPIPEVFPTPFRADILALRKRTSFSNLGRVSDPNFFNEKVGERKKSSKTSRREV
jgi:hypothetical protein